MAQMTGFCKGKILKKEMCLMKEKTNYHKLRLGFRVGITAIFRYFDLSRYFQSRLSYRRQKLERRYIEIIVMLDDYRDIASHVYIAVIKS